MILFLKLEIEQKIVVALKYLDCFFQLYLLKITALRNHIKYYQQNLRMKCFARYYIFDMILKAFSYWPNITFST